MSMQTASENSEGEPMMDINTTPLIDVMLVLLLMFIITIPLQTHAVKIDLPAACPSCPEIRGDTNTITVDAAGQVAWNETAVSMPNLRTTLLRTQRMDPVPELHLLPDPGARYGKVDEVLAEIKRARVSKFGFVGNEAHRDLF